MQAVKNRLIEKKESRCKEGEEEKDRRRGKQKEEKESERKK